MASRAKQVAVCVAVTFAEAPAAPDESVSVPTMLPRPCPSAPDGNNNRAIEMHTNLAFIMFLPGAGHSGSCTPWLPRPRFLLPLRRISAQLDPDRHKWVRMFVLRQLCVNNGCLAMDIGGSALGL